MFNRRHYRLRSRSKPWLALVVLICAWVPGVWAEVRQGQVIDWLYEVEQYVADQGAQNRRAAAQSALLRVLSRTTGLVSVPRSPVIAQALARPERYYVQYVYFDPQALSPRRRQQIDSHASTGATDLALRFSFQREAIQQLARQARLPSWWSRRPSTVVWMVQDSAQGRRLIDSDDAKVSDALHREAYRRGLPLLFPSMDLQDSLLVNPAVVWGKFTDVLDQASARYHAGQYLVGRFSVQEVLGQRFYTGEWLLRSGRREDSQFLRSASEAELARSALILAAQPLLDEQLVFGDAVNAHDLWVSGIDNLNAYASLMTYLQSLEFVDGVRLLGVQGDTLALQLQSAAARDRLLALLTGSGRLRAAQPSWGGAVAQEAAPESGLLVWQTDS